MRNIVLNHHSKNILPTVLKQANKKKLIISALVLASLFFVFRSITSYYNIPFYTYPGFGIKIPPGYSKLGIDISHHQHKINWKQVSEMRDLGKKVKFVFMKATQGNYLTDNQFKRNWSEAKKYEIDRGAYLYFDPRRSGSSQAAYFIQRVTLEEGDFAPVIDFEELRGVSKARAQKEFMACAEALETHYGIKPILYTYASFYNKNLNEAYEDYPLWIAHYRDYGRPSIDRDWHIWQFSDCGKMNGIGGNVDFNVSDKSWLSMRKLKVQE